MNDSLKKLLNIISYTLNVVFITFLIIGIKGSNSTDNADEINSTENTLKSIKECIIRQENANLPLTKQNMDNVNSIKIDKPCHYDQYRAIFRLSCDHMEYHRASRDECSRMGCKWLQRQICKEKQSCICRNQQHQSKVKRRSIME